MSNELAENFPQNRNFSRTNKNSTRFQGKTLFSRGISAFVSIISQDRAAESDGKAFFSGEKQFFEFVTRF